MLRHFAAVAAVLFEHQFAFGIQLVLRCYIIVRLALGANESNFYAMLALLGHINVQYQKYDKKARTSYNNRAIGYQPVVWLDVL